MPRQKSDTAVPIDTFLQTFVLPITDSGYHGRFPAFTDVAIKHSDGVHPLEQSKTSRRPFLRRRRPNRFDPLDCPSTLRHPSSHCLRRSSYTTISSDNEAPLLQKSTGIGSLGWGEGGNAKMVPFTVVNQRSVSPIRASSRVADRLYHRD